MAKTKKKLKLSIFEIVWYSLSGAMGLWGLTYIILGLVADYANVPNSENGVRKASAAIAKAFGLDFLGWGMILLAIGVVMAVVVLLIFSKKADREYEKELRRQAIRASALASTLTTEEVESASNEIHEEVISERETTEVVDEDETPVEDNPQE